MKTVYKVGQNIYLKKETAMTALNDHIKTQFNETTFCVFGRKVYGNKLVPVEETNLQETLNFIRFEIIDTEGEMFFIGAIIEKLTLMED